jgi:hypothetical protein
MVETGVPPAWVQLPDPSEIRPAPSGGYNFGFVATMGRLIRAHPRIGRAFSALFAEIMFSPEGVLFRREREMVAAVAAAAQDCTY